MMELAARQREITTKTTQHRQYSKTRKLLIAIVNNRDCLNHLTYSNDLRHPSLLWHTMLSVTQVCKQAIEIVTSELVLLEHTLTCLLI